VTVLIQSDAHHRHFGNAVLWGGLTAGLLDATDGVIAFAFKGMNPIQVLQFIASGALGKDAFNGGLTTALVGLGFHFFISFVVAFLYAFVAERFQAILQHPILFGLVYGAAVYLVMTYLVLPLTAVSPTAFELPYFLNGLIGHALFVGLPIAIFAQRKIR
jgi:uncharacterized membrane protein YagU involved in acid resistance